MVHQLVTLGLATVIPKAAALADLICIAFYYLLRVGEYAYTPPTDGRRTRRFRVKDVTFRRADHTLISPHAPLTELLQATHATLTISNQKNGVRGQSIHHHCTGLPTSPVKALARRVAHIMAHTPDINTCLSTYYDERGVAQQIRPRHVNDRLKLAVTEQGLQAHGYSPSNVSSHSLRAGGAMAMKLNGIDTIVIQKQGRWTSNTFLQYIHEQIGAFTAGVASKMSRHIPYTNMAAHVQPQLLPPGITTAR